VVRTERGNVRRHDPPNLKDLIPHIRTALVLDLLEHPDERLGPDPSAACEGLLLESLGRSVAGLDRRLGVDKTKSTWGALHTVNLSHPIGRWTAEGSKLLNVTGGVSGGESNTVMARWGALVQTPRARHSCGYGSWRGKG
jgi:penicillin amidase